MLLDFVGESGSARIYSVSRDSWEPSICSEIPPILGEVEVLIAELGGSAAGVVVRGFGGGSEYLRSVLGFSRFEKKARKEGAMSGSRRREESGGWRWHGKVPRIKRGRKTSQTIKAPKNTPFG